MVACIGTQNAVFHTACSSSPPAAFLYPVLQLESHVHVDALAPKVVLRSLEKRSALTPVMM